MHFPLRCSDPSRQFCALENGQDEGVPNLRLRHAFLAQPELAFERQPPSGDRHGLRQTHGGHGLGSEK